MVLHDSVASYDATDNLMVGLINTSVFPCEIFRGTGIAQFFRFQPCRDADVVHPCPKSGLKQDKAKHWRRHCFSLALSSSDGSAR